jgi:Fe-S-cluster containining protein
MLTEQESYNPVFRGKVDCDNDGCPQIVFERGGCPFLDRKTKRCSVYEVRPAACRGYVCHEAGGHSTVVIVNYPALQRHLRKKLKPKKCSTPSH